MKTYLVGNWSWDFDDMCVVQRIFEVSAARHTSALRLCQSNLGTLIYEHRYEPDVFPNANKKVALWEILGEHNDELA
jgi:serine protease inhibitor